MRFITILALAGGALAQGKWSIIGENKVVCIHTLVLPRDRILCMERPHNTVRNPYPVNQNTDGRVVTETSITPAFNSLVSDMVLYNPFCAGHAQLPDGSLLVVGGDDPLGNNTAGATILTDGRAKLRRYVPCLDSTCQTGSWDHSIPDMVTGRWYPTVTTLSTGEAIIVSGSLKNLDFTNLNNTNNPSYEYFPMRAGVWPKRLDILDRHFPFNLYPAVFQLANGKVMMFVSNSTAIMDPVTDTVDETSVQDILLPDKFPWIYPYTPTSVMFPLTKKNNYTSTVMICGGTRVENVKADERCISINFGEANPQWKQVDSMRFGRVMPDSVILPDGKILFANGAANGLAGGDAGDPRNAWGPIFETSMFDPEAPEGQRWTPAGTMVVPRLYHSGLVLLSDGRVVSTGSEEQNYVDIQVQNRTECFPNPGGQACTNPYEYRMEAYEPIYLSLPQERPAIRFAPPKTTYMSKFLVSMSTDATKVNKAAFLRYSTSTHSINMDQRYVELDIIAVNTTHVYLQAPANSAIAPPGNYYLFLLRDGKPSVGATVNLNAGAAVAEEAPQNGRSPSQPSSSSFTSISILSVIIVFVTFLF